VIPFLSDRTQRVKLDSFLSDEVKVTSSIVQGSVLGPTLFNCFINQLASRLDSQVRLYADDCLIYRTIKSSADKLALQNDLNIVDEWCKASGMSLNIEKCNMIAFRKSAKNRDATYFIGNASNILMQASYVIYLGVTISYNLAWELHIKTVIKKAKYALYSIQRNFYRATRETKELLYFSLVRSIMEYCNAIWDPYLKCHIAFL